MHTFVAGMVAAEDTAPVTRISAGTAMARFGPVFTWQLTHLKCWCYSACVFQWKEDINVNFSELRTNGGFTFRLV